MDLVSAPTDEYMSRVAHDVRNPVAVIKLAAQMAQRQVDRNDVPAVLSRLETIVTQADRLADMMEAFVEASRIASGRLVLHPEDSDLVDVIRVAADRARARAGAASNRPLDLDLPETCPGSWDRQRMLIAVRALVLNAYIYGDPDAPVSVEGRREANTLRLTVSGGGVGPSDDERLHLFEPFFQGPKAQESSETGPGLGLFNARGIVRAHGGDMCPANGDEPDAFEMFLPCGRAA